MGKIDNIIKRLTEAPEDNLPKVDKKREFKVGDVKSGDGIKSTITNIDKETGRIEWDIDYLPNFDELFDGATDLVKTAKGVYTKAKTDDKLRLIYDEARVLRNKIRTHIRNEYPEEYRRMTMKMTEGELDEMSTTGGGNASFSPGTGMTYATPYAFKRPKKKQKAIPENKSLKTTEEYAGKESVKTTKDYLNQNSKDTKSLKEINIGSIAGTMAALRKDKNKPSTRVMWDDMSSEEKENLLLTVIKDPDDPRIDKFIDTKYNLMPLSILRDMGINESLDLKSYGYKLVPKNKAGNYVQKGSKLDVKQLFEDQKEFQDKRVAAFDAIEQEMNDIYKMLSNAKNETSEYYNDNPSSYTVIKPTDLVLDYIKDIKDLLKGE